MKKLFLGLLAASLFTSVHAADNSTKPAAEAPPPAVKDTAPERYTVVKGDTLWGISGRYLQDPWRWPEIWQANQQISNPHLIYPGDQLVLCHIKDRAVVAVDQGHGCADIPGATGPSSDQHITGSGNNYSLHPQIRSKELDLAIPAIPLQAVRSFLNDSRVVDYDLLQAAPYVLAANDGHVVAGAGDEIYARGTFENSTNSYGIYRAGVRYMDPETKEVLGYEATAIGNGKLVALDHGVATVNVVNTLSQEVRYEDKLLPKEERTVTAVFTPHNPAGVKPGRIIRVFDSISSAANLSVIVINRGEREGVRQGDTFALYHHGVLVRDSTNNDVVRLPSKNEGLAMVFRSFEKVSYALVLRSSGVVQTGDEVRPPISGD